MLYPNGSCNNCTINGSPRGERRRRGDANTSGLWVVSLDDVALDGAEEDVHAEWVKAGASGACHGGGMRERRLRVEDVWRTELTVEPQGVDGSTW